MACEYLQHHLEWKGLPLVSNIKHCSLFLKVPLFECKRVLGDRIYFADDHSWFQKFYRDKHLDDSIEILDMACLAIGFFISDLSAISPVLYLLILRKMASDNSRQFRCHKPPKTAVYLPYFCLK